jgi:hypothetical protein
MFNQEINALLGIGPTGAATTPLAGAANLGPNGPNAVTGYIGTDLFGLDGIDVESQALVALTLLAIGLIASYPPALRATRVDPLVALRHQ